MTRVLTLSWLSPKTELLERLTFNDARHVYTLDKRIVPNVTSIIEPHLPFYGMPADRRQAALERGSIVHALTEAHDSGHYDAELDALARGEGWFPWLESWVKFLRLRKPDIFETERRVYNTAYNYAGTVDRLAYIDGEPTLIEIKTGTTIPEYAWQTAAYQQAVNETSNVTVTRRLVVCLQPDGSTPHMEEHKDTADWAAFKGALSIFQWKLALGRSKTNGSAK